METVVIFGVFMAVTIVFSVVASLKKQESISPAPEAHEVVMGLPEEFGKQYSIKVVGVTFSNPDGTNRQAILKKCSPGQVVELLAEPNNQFDKTAIAVLTSSGEMLGYLPNDSWVVRAIYDEQKQTKAYIYSIEQHQGCYGCVLKVALGNKIAQPWIDADGEIHDLINAARRSEKTQPDLSVAQYRDAIARIKVMDSNGPVASTWRTARYPIARLSLVLSRENKTEEALAEIAYWREYTDPVGVIASEHESVTKRELRLAKSSPAQGQ